MPSSFSRPSIKANTAANRPHFKANQHELTSSRNTRYVLGPSFPRSKRRSVPHLARGFAMAQNSCHATTSARKKAAYDTPLTQKPQDDGVTDQSMKIADGNRYLADCIKRIDRRLFPYPDTHDSSIYN